ncbi:hypothetical protein CEP53_002710 [Fusarium sp. AF-6]|nr:hypothetical protein CEP53_002710 [Fusarium sp. AF-6]
MASKIIARGVDPRPVGNSSSLQCGLLFENGDEPDKLKYIPSTNSLSFSGERGAQQRRRFTMSHRPLNEEEAKRFENSSSAPKMTRNNATELCIVSVNLALDPTVVGFGIPFHGEDGTIDGWVNKDDLIHDTIKLTELLQRKTFTFLVQATGEQAEKLFDLTGSHYKPFDYGYGDKHNWDMTRYSHQIPRNRGSRFSAKICYDDFNQRDTALTQMHVQDVWDFHAALEEIETMWIPAFPRHWRATRRALRGDFTPINVEFHAKSPSHTQNDDHRRNLATWNAVHLSYGSDLMRKVDLTDRIALGLIRPASDKGRKHSPEAFNSYNATTGSASRTTVRLICRSGIGNEKKRIEAVNRLSSLNIWPAVMEHDMFAERKSLAFNDILVGQGLWDLFKATSSFRFPHFNLFDGVTDQVRDACIDHVFEDDRDRVQQYFSKLHFGIGLVSAAPGMGKSHLASIIITLMCLNPSIQQLYVSAASNGATDNILERTNNIAKPIVDKLIHAGYPVKRLMLIRGYRGDTELVNCLKALKGISFEESGIWNPSPWHFERSLCWWTLRALGSSAVPPLTSDDCTQLWDLHQRLGALVSTEDQASPIDGDYLKFTHLVHLARGLITFGEYTNRQTSEAHQNRLTRLMDLVISCANVVATTPAASSNNPYFAFNSTKAKAVVFDEAGTMFRADGLLVFGNTPRPMIVVGDPKQLAPVLATAIERLHVPHRKPHYLNRRDDKDDGWPTNRFTAEAEISWLSWFIHLGFPVFHLHTQHRMAEGLFDLMLKTSYNDIKRYFKYSPLCRLIDFPLGIRVEQYIQTKHRLPSESPDKLLPVFFQTNDCPCRNYPDSASRLNPRQADCIAKCLVRMMEELSMSPADVAVLTPYRANLRALQKRFRKEEILEAVICATPDTFQGREAHIIVVALCVTEETGAGFANDARHLNVALTRHKSGLFIFGDLETKTRRSSEWADDNTTTGETMANVFRIIKKSRRIVNLKGDPRVDPDSYWERLKTSSKFL